MFCDAMRGLVMETPKTEAMRRAHDLLRAGGVAALSVIDPGHSTPFTSLVNVAVGDDLAPLLLISDLSHHTKCLKANRQASVMLHAPINTDDDPMLTFRATITGAFEMTTHELAAKPFLARHPYAEMYSQFGDFNFWRLQADHAHIIAGFGRAYSVRFKDLLSL
jgi:heme iron utilization protein